MPLLQLANGIHAGGDIFNDAFVPYDISVVAPDRIAAKQAVDDDAVLFLETGFKIFYIPVKINLFLEHPPVPTVTV